MADQRRGGKIQVQSDGEVYDAKGNWTYNLGKPKREAIIGADGIHGYKETQQVPFVEGEITDRRDLSLAKLVTLKDATVTLALANGKTVVLRSAWYAGEGDGSTEEGNIKVRFEGLSANEA
jgi:hypothetical protein